MTKDEFKNTKWDVRGWSELDKKRLIQMATGEGVDFNMSDVDLVIIDHRGDWFHGDIGLFAAAPEVPKTYFDAFPPPKPVEKFDDVELRVDDEPQLSGGSCNYYIVEVKHPTTAPEPYSAECNDVIESLGLTFAEANIYKEIWRTANGRTHNNGKPDNDPKRAAEKVLFFALREALHNGVDIQKLIDGVNIK